LRLALIVVVLGTLSPRLSWADARSEARTQVSFGITVAQSGLWREARYRFEQAVTIDPTYANACCNLAIAYEELGLME
jgi:Tfp pilus assembly protein PilF